MKYGQKECHDCLGIFPSNVMRRFRFEEVSGSSERMFDPNRKGDYLNPSRTRVHTRVRDVFLCPSCYPKRKRKSYFKEILYWAVALIVGLFFITFIMKNTAKRDDQSGSTAVVEEKAVPTDESPTNSGSEPGTMPVAPAVDDPSSSEAQNAAEQASEDAENRGTDPVVSDVNAPPETTGTENGSE